MTRRPATAERLDLASHPEGGWYRRTWTGPAADELLVLGPDVVQGLVPAGRRQRARPVQAEVLVSCVVSPGFEWSGFALG